MPTPTNKLYTPSSAAEIRDDFLTDIRIEARKYATEDEVDRVTRPGTDWFILATAVGNLGLLQYSNIATSDANTSVLYSTGNSLDEWRSTFGLTEISPAPSSGRLVVSLQPANAVVNFNNHEFVLPNGKRGKVDGVVVGVTDQGEVPVTTIDAGSDCNLAAQSIVRFVSPPPNVKSEAKVSVNSPLTGGADKETDERKRDRILNRLQTIPAGGNWGYAIEQAMNALATVQYAFAYPALGGPASVKIVLVKDIDPATYDFSRVLSTQATSIVRDALHSTMPDDIEIVVASAAGQSNEVAISVSLPAASQAGGNGKGWLDYAPWPLLTGGQTRVQITALFADPLKIQVNALTLVAPIPGKTHISWWSSADQAFYTKLVTGVTFVALGVWHLFLETSLVDHNNTGCLVGEFISPAAVNMADYGKTWQSSMRRLGPGENTNDPNRIPRALRRPFIQDAWNSDLTVRQLTEMIAAHEEILDAAWSYRQATSPTVPAVTSSPRVFMPSNFGIYKL